MCPGMGSQIKMKRLTLGKYLDGQHACLVELVGTVRRNM